MLKVFLISSLLFPCWACGDNHTTGNQMNIHLEFPEGKETAIRLETKAAPLNQIIKTIGKKTGAVFHYSFLPETPITATCAGATLKQVMECLLAKRIGIIEQQPEKNKPAEFWLLASSLETCQPVNHAPDERTKIDAKPLSHNANGGESFSQSTGMTRQEISGTLLEQLKNAENIEQKAQALANIAADGNIADPKVRAALDNAVQDENPLIRGQALSALVNLDKESASDLLTHALHDNDASVRLIALDHAGEDIEILNQALADSDPGVREFAAVKLQSMTKQEIKSYD